MPDFQLSQIRAIMLGVRDVPEAVAFYKEKLGLNVIMIESQLTLLQCGTITLGLSRGHVQAAQPVAGAIEVVFKVEDVKAAYKSLVAQGICFVSAPRQATLAEWVAHFRDMDGHLLSIFGPEGTTESSVPTSLM
jgi:predicted enzyme related to lactoylglutathione lyase